MSVKSAVNTETIMERLLRNIMLISLLTVLLLRVRPVAGYVAAELVRQETTLVTDIPGVVYYPDTAEATPKYYKILDIHSEDSEHMEGGHMYVGGRNVLTELSQADLALVSALEVKSTRDNLPTGSFDCETLEADNTEFYCQFYVTYVQEVNETTSILCGTNALFPRCLTFQTGASSLNKSISWDAIGLTASVPDQQTSTLAITEGSNLVVYAGAPTKVQDKFAFSRTTFGSTGAKTVMTDTTNSDWIESGSTNSRPSFIGDPIPYNDKMYFFFREEAVEAKNVEKVVYSRVGQVCMDDTGGVSGVLDNKWTTFLKARLSCSTQGNIKFYFDDLQSIYRSTKNTNIIFGVFSTPSTSIPASAVCAYDLTEIEQLFAASPFKNQKDSNSFWVNVAKADLPVPRPGTCAEEMPTANYIDLAAIQLMSSLVPNKADYTTTRTWSSSVESDYPIMILQGYWLRHIVVQEQTPSGIDIFFFATDEGQIFKAYLYDGKPRIIDEVLLKVNGGSMEAINALRISDDGETLYASTSSRVYRLPAVNCGRFRTCQECVQGLDPDCAWVTEGQGSCQAVSSGLRDLNNASIGACPLATTTQSQTMPATPASETTAETTLASELTTDGEIASTPKQAKSHTGERREEESCTAWIVAFVVLLLVIIVSLVVFICIHWKKQKKYPTSSPIRRNDREESQKLPLNDRNHSDNDDDEPDETVPMTDEGRNNTPHKESIINEVKPHQRKNGQTPVKGTTISVSEA